MAGVGGASSREEVQKYQVKITQAAYDILVGEGLIDTGSGVTMFDVQKAIIEKEEQGEVTSSNLTRLAPLGDNQAGTQRTVNGTSRSSGSEVGLGSWVGTFSGSCDIYRTGSGFSVFHFTEFSGALSASSFEVGCAGSGDTTADYGRVFIGAPSECIATTHSLGTAPGGIYLKPIPFSGSFHCLGTTATGTFHTAESGSASGSRVLNNATSSNTQIPGGTYTAKWISGSFNGMGYTSSLGSTLFTSSAVTTADLNNMSASNFVGSICVASGGFTGTTSSFGTGNLTPGAINTGYPSTSTPGDIFNGGLSLSATCESAFSLTGFYGSQYFRNSGSLVDNDDTGALVSGLVNGTIFAIAPSGSGFSPNGENLEFTVSGSIESIANPNQYSNRGPGTPYKGGAAQANYFKQPRTVSVSGSIDKFQKKARKAKLTEKFSPRGG